MNREEKALKKMLAQWEAPTMSDEETERLSEILRQEIKRKPLISERHIMGGILNQMGHISPVTWACQVLVLILGGHLLSEMQSESILQTVALIIPLIGLVGFPELMKSFHCDMWELEESCFYNLREILLMKMMIFGMVDGMILCILMGAAGKGGMEWYEVLCSILIPYNLSCTVYLELFRVMKRKCSGYALVMAGFFMVVILYVIRQITIVWNGTVTETAVKALAVVGCGISLLLLIIVAGRILSSMKEEEQGKWNFVQNV